MYHSVFGWLGAALVVISAVPYTIRAWQRKIEPNPISWGLWTVIGFALLVTYISAGATESAWVYVFGFTNPLIISVIVFVRSRKREPLGLHDYIALVMGLAALALWLFVRSDESMSGWALVLAIAADACAVLPTLAYLRRDPMCDRPFAWSLFALGNFVNLFAIRDGDITEYILPIYMVIGGLLITAPMILYRLKHRVPLKHWY